MIIVQYDIGKDGLDIDIVNHTMETLGENYPNEKIIVAPSGLSISEWSDEDGLEQLENLHRLLGAVISDLRDTIGKSDKNIGDAIRYLNICSSSPYYQKAWETTKKFYGIE